MTHRGNTMRGLILLAMVQMAPIAACGGDDAPTTREVCEQVAIAACDAADRCDEIGSGDQFIFETVEQCLTGFPTICCLTQGDCEAASTASAQDVDTCEAALVFRDCAAAGTPDGCSGIFESL